MQKKCVFCDAPLRLRVGDGLNPEDIELGYPCACTVARQLGVLTRCALLEALYREPQLKGCLYAAATLPEASIFSYRGKDFPGIVPARFHDSGLWVVRLPAFLESRLEELATTQLEAAVMQSADLMSARTHLGWMLPELEVHFPLSGFEHLLPGPGDRPCVLILFLCAGSMLLTVHPIDEELIFSLQACSMGSDENYRPYRVWTDEELKKNAEEASAGEPELFQIWDDGTLDLELTGFIPRLHEAGDIEPD